MRYCKYCGNQVSDNATFCGICGHELAPQEPGGMGRLVADLTGGMKTDGSSAHLSNVDVFAKAQGILMLLLAGAALALPVLESSSLVQVGAGFSFSVNISSLMSSISMLPQLGEAVASQMGSSSSYASQMAGLTGAMGTLSLWAMVVRVLMAVALVGTFVTSARCLEGTTKSTLVTGWLFVPYALVSLLVVNGISSEINGLVASAAAVSSSSVPGIGAIELVHTTFWPWILLVLSIGCGLLGVLRQTSMRSGNR